MKKLKNIKSKTKDEILVENLKDLKEIFDKHNIKFWLDWGTLLGAIREGKIIEWDGDIDLGVMSDDYNEIVLTFSELKEKGFIVNEIPLPIPNSDMICIKFSFGRLGYSLDVWSYLKGRDTLATFGAPRRLRGNLISSTLSRISWPLWRLLLSVEVNSQNKFKSILEKLAKCSLFLLPTKLKDSLAKIIRKFLTEKDPCSYIRMAAVPKYHLERLEEIEFYGTKFNIPFDVQNYLKEKYGENWRFPDNKWRWHNKESFKSISQNKKTNKP